MASTLTKSEELRIIKYYDLDHDPTKSLVEVERTSDGEILLGCRLDKKSTSQGFMEFFNDTPANDLIKQLLNHENLVSIAGEATGARIVKANGSTGVQPCRYLVYDYCDAGTLHTMLQKPPAPLTSTGFIPPSLCWHVLVSLLRALAWLHDGYREDGVGTTVEAPRGMDYDGDEQDNWFQDADWLAVLHCNITPENVFLQRPRGTETYGLVKLGNFSNAQTATHVRGANGLLVAFRRLGDAESSSDQLEELRDGNFGRFPRVSRPKPIFQSWLRTLVGGGLFADIRLLIDALLARFVGIFILHSRFRPPSCRWHPVPYDDGHRTPAAQQMPSV